jgi:hypothetical protein
LFFITLPEIAMVRLFVWLVLLGLSISTAQARDCSLRARDKSDTSLTYRTAAGAALLVIWQGSELGKGSLVAETPRWVDEKINSFDQLGEKLRWSPGRLDEAAASMSDNALALNTLAVPIIAFVGESRGICLYEDLLVFEETIATAMVLNQAAKFIARRERPFTRDLSDTERQEICQSKRDCVDLNLSFYSGHSTMGFVVAVAAGTIAKERGYESATATYSIGLLGAGLTAYLRVAAGKHYLSDVTLGALMGAGIGYLVPTYLQPLKQGKRKISLVPQLENNTQGLSLMGSW